MIPYGGVVIGGTPGVTDINFFLSARLIERVGEAINSASRLLGSYSAAYLERSQDVNKGLSLLCRADDDVQRAGILGLRMASTAWTPCFAQYDRVSSGPVNHGLAITSYGLIISLSSCSRMWQCQT